ncbi:PREDICTED: uncharacterized protein LOC104813482 [Tarenaya hassleriana]|uniref:uncharacterized protein LOC104813482 n=1 Tax=Tarenaya hassleriana TaxID=28532 RepID=UPI00053C592C|nr:PREDICTED: uncharacterized protein LOC104813482 [Tarenaya hassleriana]
MDPCPFIRIDIDSLALQLPQPATSRPASTGVHPSATPCYCKLRISNFPSQTALLPLSSATAGEYSGDNDGSPSDPGSSAPGFDLDGAAISRLSSRPVALRVSVYAGRMGTTCGLSAGKILGHVQVNVDVAAVRSRAVVCHSGWMKLGGETGKPAARLHLVVKAKPDPRFVFKFGGEPECSPVVYQIQGNIKQPVFSCNFSADRNSRTRPPSPVSGAGERGGCIMRTFSGEVNKRQVKERKGWMIIVYDLSGSAVAAASMATPFVPSPGSDRVSRANPGAWLILQPHCGLSVGSWKPWGRLEAWRERGGSDDGLGYRFELVTDVGGGGISIAEGTMSVKHGGRFCIDGRRSSPDPRSPVRGFVMSATVEGEGRVSKPAVEVAAEHVGSTADAALFVALSAAIDLSIDACRLFSRKLRKELCHGDEEV